MNKNTRSTSAVRVEVMRTKTGRRAYVTPFTPDNANYLDYSQQVAYAEAEICRPFKSAKSVLPIAVENELSALRLRTCQLVMANAAAE